MACWAELKDTARERPSELLRRRELRAVTTNGAFGLFLAPLSTALAEARFFTALANGALVAFFLASARRALEQNCANADW